jgi:predicted transcriptional regulator
VLGNITFEDAVKRLHTEHLHRLFVVDAQNKPVGVFSLTDVLTELAHSIS